MVISFRLASMDHLSVSASAPLARQYPTVVAPRRAALHSSRCPGVTGPVSARCAPAGPSRCSFRRAPPAASPPLAPRLPPGAGAFRRRPGATPAWPASAVLPGGGRAARMLAPSSPLPLAAGLALGCRAGRFSYRTAVVSSAGAGATPTQHCEDCWAAGVRRRATFGTNFGEPLRCKAHRLLPSDMDVIHRMCEECETAGVARRPIFGIPGGPPVHCEAHKVEGEVDVTHAKRRHAIITRVDSE